MLSTQNPTALPDAAALRDLCKALAVLDAVISPEWEYRYYSYNATWSEGEEVLQMRNGSGDEMLVLFRPEGCCINGLMHEYEQPEKAMLTRGLPSSFVEFMFGEPVSSIGTTFCLWYTPADGWQTNAPEKADDGSEDLLFIFDGRPETYADWATVYYTIDADRKPIDAEAVASIYRGEMLTRPLVLELTDELEDWEQLAADVREISYPYDFAK